MLWKFFRMVWSKGVVLWEKVEMRGINWVSWVFGGVLVPLSKWGESSCGS